MTRSTVDSGALNLAIDMLKRNAERHGQPSMLEAAELLQKSAATEGAMSCENCKHSGVPVDEFDENSDIHPTNFIPCKRIKTFDISGELAYTNQSIVGPHVAVWDRVNTSVRVTKDHYCKLWESKDD